MAIVLYTPQQQLARRMRAKRKLLRLTQRELAEVVGTSQAAIVRLEAGESNPTLNLIQRVVTALDLDLILTIKPTHPKGVTPEWLNER